jgi:hypothetical protein
MSKKDYLLWAKMLADLKPQLEDNVFNTIVTLFLRVLKADNPAFNEEKFVNAINKIK